MSDGIERRPRIGMGQLEWVLNKLLKGAGPGVDPTPIDVPTGAPSGLIAMWHGTIANIPVGWVICDGNSSTPNLLTRFVQGVATALTDPGATGGATAKTTAGHQHDSPVGISTDTTIVLGGANPHGAGSGMTKTGNQPAGGESGAGNFSKVSSETDGIADIRPKFYDVAFLMKT